MGVVFSMAKGLVTLLVCLTWTPAWSMVPTIRNCQGSNLNDDALCLEINFNDGGPNEKAFLNRIDNCVHSGSFENVDVAIAASSEECPRIETSNMQVTFSHPRSEDHLFFNVNPMTGLTMRVEVDEMAKVDDPLVDPDHIITKGIGASVVIPDAGYILDIVVFYDTLITAAFGADVETRVNAALAHAHVLHQVRTSPGKMKFNVLKMESLNFPFTVADGLSNQNVIDKVTGYDVVADLYVFVTTQSAGGVVGKAWLGTVCNSDSSRQKRVSVNSHFGGDQGTGATIAHEIGHNLGLSHDFISEDNCLKVPRFAANGLQCDGINGVMDYCTTANKWTPCSLDDFKDTVQDSINMNGEFCLKPNDATPPTTLVPNSPCGSPEYFGDGMCDDDNNDADCGYDGGDCCPGATPLVGWNDYCTDCTCIQEGASCCDTIETYPLTSGDSNSDISFFAYGTWTKMADKVEGYDAYVSDADASKVIYYSCSGSWRIYEAASIGECNGYIFTDAKTSCPHSEVQWNWSYWSGELGNGFAAKCTGPAGHANFCTVDNPCPTDEGDCDLHSECQTGLICGTDNCPASKGYASWVDCCTRTTTTAGPGTTTTMGPGTTTTMGPGTTTTMGPVTPAPPPDCGKLNGPSGTVKSPGYPEPPPNGMVECQFTVKCGQNGGNKNLIVKSEVGYALDYSCVAPPPCEDKWPQKKCKKCNEKKCKKDSKCQKNCKATCKLCDDRILPFDY